MCKSFGSKWVSSAIKSMLMLLSKDLDKNNIGNDGFKFLLKSKLSL
jgi:hypothetical protein